MKTLFLNPPSYEGFDGGAGSRYQAKREIRSFWYPTWLAQPAALVPGEPAHRRARARAWRSRTCCLSPPSTSSSCCTRARLPFPPT